MAKVRFATYAATHLLEAATGVWNYTFQPLLRDVIPDQRFKVLWIEGWTVGRGEVGDHAMIFFGKNVPTSVGIAADVENVQHGQLVRWEDLKDAAGGIVEAKFHLIVFPQPLDFDENDSLLASVHATNTHTPAMNVEMAWTIGYTVG